MLRNQAGKKWNESETAKNKTRQERSTYVFFFEIAVLL